MAGLAATWSAVSLALDKLHSSGSPQFFDVDKLGLALKTAVEGLVNAGAQGDSLVKFIGSGGLERLAIKSRYELTSSIVYRLAKCDCTSERAGLLEVCEFLCSHRLKMFSADVAARVVFEDGVSESTRVQLMRTYCKDPEFWARVWAEADGGYHAERQQTLLHLSERFRELATRGQRAVVLNSFNVSAYSYPRTLFGAALYPDSFGEQMRLLRGSCEARLAVFSALGALSAVDDVAAFATDDVVRCAKLVGGRGGVVEMVRHVASGVAGGQYNAELLFETAKQCCTEDPESVSELLALESSYRQYRALLGAAPSAASNVAATPPATKAPLRL